MILSALSYKRLIFLINSGFGGLLTGLGSGVSKTGTVSCEVSWGGSSCGGFSVRRAAGAAGWSGSRFAEVI